MSDVKPVALDVARVHELISGYKEADKPASKQRARREIVAYFIAHDAALQAEIVALRKDAERLDWVQRNLLSADFEYEYQPGKTRPVLIIAWPRDVAIGGNARMNFDAAIAKEK